MEIYTYSILDDFPNQVISATCLDAEINASAIAVVLDGTTIEGDDVNVSFTSELNSSDIIILDSIVANHNHECPLSEQQEEDEESLDIPLSIEKDDVEVSEIVNIINFEGNVAITDDGNGKTTVNITESGNGSNFGENVAHVESENCSSTSNTNSYEDKIDYDTQVLPIGTYRIGVYAEGIISNSSHEYLIKATIDDLEFFNTSGNDVGNDNIWKGNSGFVYVDFSTEISHNIKVQWKSSQRNKVASIRSARIDIWRVA